MVRKTTLILLCLSSLLILTGCSKDIISFTGNLLGTITDAISGEPISGVEVLIEPSGTSVRTGANGHYEFSNLEAKEYTVYISKTNYQSDQKKIMVTMGLDNRLDFVMTPSQPKLEVLQKVLDFGNESTTLTLGIKNIGHAVLNWQISEDISWLSCLPASGRLQPEESVGIVINVNRNGMAAGDYSQTFGITSNGGIIDVKVNMSVQGMSVSVSPNELDFGSTNSTMQLTMSGGNNVSYTLTPSNDWIIPNKTSGVFSKSENIIVAVDRANRSEGNYEGSLSLRVGEHSSEIPVRMNIVAKEYPAVNLLSVDNITSTGATFKGAIVRIGSSRVIKHGFCWSKQENPELDTAESCNFGDCTNAKDMTYTTNILESSTTYYVRAYAENSEGISYSNQYRFTTEEADQKPEVETGTAQNIQSRQAEFSGKILKIGTKEGITQHGHVWGRTPSPTIDNQRTQLGSTNVTGGYISALTALEPNVTYYVRAYATNSIGTSYGDDVTFTTSYDVVTLTTTAASNITHNSATIGGSISSEGGNTIIERGVCWSVDGNPTINNVRKSTESVAARYDVRIDGLSELTTYHARAYVITSNDKVYYGNDITFSTTHEIQLPRADVTTVDNIGVTFATFHSSVLGDGDGNISDCGFCYSYASNPTINDSKISCGKKTASFMATAKDLKENTTYYVRSYVTNEAGTAYGEEVNFATLEILVPTLSPVTVKSVTHRSASFVAQILSANNGTISDAGFVYSTNHNPGLTNHRISVGTNSDMSIRVNELSPKTTYYVRAYAVNEKGVNFSEETSFTTDDEPEGSNIETGGYDEEHNWNKQ